VLKPAINLQTLPQHSATVISFILVIACAYSLAQLTWMMVPTSDTSVATLAPAHINGASLTRTQRNNIGQLAMAHLFGNAEKATVDTAKVATVTRLNLTLRGVFAASDPKYAIAIIASGKNGNEEIYGIGDPLPGNATLREVHPDHVILERSGQLEILKLAKDAPLNLPHVSTGLSRYDGNDPGAALGEIRKTILRSPTSFGDYALPMVVRENGKQVGYRLQAQPKGKELLRKIGLEPNDIITSINGVKMDDPRNGISALRQLSTAQSINITVQRNGAQVPLTIQLH
jgi:general secretion pathway protein C